MQAQGDSSKGRSVGSLGVNEVSSPHRALASTAGEWADRQNGGALPPLSPVSRTGPSGDPAGCTALSSGQQVQERSRLFTSWEEQSRYAASSV